MIDWVETTIGEIGRVVTGKTPPTSNPENYGGDVPFVTPTDMDGRRYLDTTGRTLTKVGLAKIGKAEIPKDTVLVSCIGSDMGKAAMAAISCVTNQQINSVIVGSECDPKYVYYNLSARKEEIRLAAGGSAQPILNKSAFSRLRLFLPPIEAQKEIASILSCLDDKIELNRRMNHTLEVMARAIFKDWFVGFGPTRAKAEGRAPYMAPELWGLFPDALDDEDKPVGWVRQPLNKFADVVYGAAFASKHFNDENKGKPLIRIRDLATHEPGVHTEEIHKKGHLIEPGDIVVGMDGEFRLQIWKGPRSWLNQRVCHFEPIAGISTSYLAEALKQPLAFFERGKVGTTVIHLGKADIDTIQLINPGNRVLQTFASITQPLVEMTVSNAQQTRLLANTRDLLLPRLMSGEIRLHDAEMIMETIV